MLFRRKAASANRPIKRRAAFVARLLPPNPEAEAIAHQLAKALATRHASGYDANVIAQLWMLADFRARVMTFGPLSYDSCVTKAQST
jgi:hypothetical protein